MCCGGCLGSIARRLRFRSFRCVASDKTFVPHNTSSSLRRVERVARSRVLIGDDMKFIRLRFVACFGFFVMLPQIALVAQQTATPVAVAPVPALLLDAKRVFISNARADSGLFPHPFTGDPDRAYNEFYAGVLSWGRYELVTSPAEADLVFEIRLMAPNGPANADKQKGA